MVAPLKPIGGREAKMQALLDPLIFFSGSFTKKNDFSLDKRDAESQQPSEIKASIFWPGSCKVALDL